MNLTNLFVRQSGKQHKSVNPSPHGGLLLME